MVRASHSSDLDLILITSQRPAPGEWAPEGRRGEGEEEGGGQGFGGGYQPREVQEILH